MGHFRSVDLTAGTSSFREAVGDWQMLIEIERESLCSM
jgi:hypothetical protein